MKIVAFFLILNCLLSCKKESAPDYSVSYKKDAVSDTIKEIIKPMANFKYRRSGDTVMNLVSKRLYELATEDQLRCLIYDQKNVYIKVAAIDALVKKNRKAAFEVFQKSLNTDDYFAIRTDCIRDTLSLAQIIASSYGNAYPENGLTDLQAKQNMKKFMEIAFQQTPLNEKRIEELKFSIPLDNEEYHEKIKEAITEKRSKHLLLPLALFKRKEDVELIKSFGKEAFEAIFYFPDDRFLEMFMQHISENENRFYKMALDNYPKKKTEAIRRAIEKYNKNKTGL